MENSQTWYIVKTSAQTCEIISDDRQATQNQEDIVQRWGPFASAQEAIARRVGLIRAGKCQPQ